MGMAVVHAQSPAANKISQALASASQKLRCHSAAFREAMRLTVTEEKETRCMSIDGILRDMQVYPKCIAGGNMRAQVYM